MPLSYQPFTVTRYTVATLPAASGMQGAELLVTDSTLNPASSTGTVAVGGGSTQTRVLSDGTNWRVVGWVGGPIQGGGGAGLVNLITTQDISNAYWAKTGVTNPAANQMMETAATSAHFEQAASGTGFPLTGVHAYSASVDVTPIGGGRYFGLGLNSFASESMNVQCDLQLGTVMTVSGGGWSSSNSLVPLGGGTYRVTAIVNATVPGTTGLNYFLYMLGGVNIFSYAGNVANGMTVNNITFYQLS